MNLTTDQFAEILRSLEAPQSERAADKRRATRVMHRCRVPVTLGSDPNAGVPTVVTVRDFSPRGVCLLHSKSIPAGSTFVMRLSAASVPAVTLLCTVAHCRSEGKSLFVIGAEFTCVLRKDGELLRPDHDADVERVRRSILA